MKKALSLLLVLAMVLSMVPAVFAADASTAAGAVENIEDIVVIGGETQTYTWVANGTGDITVTSTGDATVTITTAVGEVVLAPEINEDADTDEPWDGPVDCVTASGDITVEAGETVTIVVNNTNGSMETTLSTELSDTFYIPGTSEDHPILLTAQENTVTNAGTIWYQGYFSGMIMTVTGANSVTYNDETLDAVDGVVSTTVTSSNPRMPVVFAVTGDGEVQINFTYPLGNMSNPAQLMIDAYNDAVIEAGNTQGYYYTWTATADGTLSITMPSDMGWTYAINNMTTYVYGDTQRSDSDPVVNPASVEVAAGDEIQIMVNTYDPADVWNNPGGTLSIYASFTYPAGSEQNPIWVNESTTVTVPAGETYHFRSYAVGYTMDVVGTGSIVHGAATGTPIVLTENVFVGRGYAAGFTIENTTEAAVEYTITLTAPLGIAENPAQLVIGDNTASIEAGSQGYYYTYTATEDGTLSITMPSDMGWSYVINNMTTYVYGDTQWSDSDPVVNPGTVEVTAGDEIQIIVNTYDPADSWNAPAGDLTITASFEAEIPVADDLVFYRSNTSGGDLMLGDDIRASFAIKAPAGYSRIYLEITKDGVTSFVDKNETMSNSTYYRYTYVVPAAHMTMDINLTIWGEKDGVTYRGEELVFSIRRCAEAKLGLWINNTAAAGQCKLIMNMLYYGEKAQLQFSVNTDNLATTGLAQEYLDLITTETPSLKAYPTVDTTGMIAKLNTMGFMLQEKVKLNVIFTLTSAVTNPDEYYVEVKHIPTKDGVDPVTYTYTSKDFTLMNNNKAIQFFFDKIAPSQMRDDVEYTVYHNGEAISATYVRGMETVANYYVNNAPALADLVYAIMNYADAAKAVFG